MNSILLQKQSNICLALSFVNMFIHIREKEKISDSYDKCEEGFRVHAPGRQVVFGNELACL